MLGYKTENMGYRNMGYRSPVTFPPPPLGNVVPTCAKNSATHHKTTQWLEIQSKLYIGFRVTASYLKASILAFGVLAVVALLLLVC